MTDERLAAIRTRNELGRHLRPEFSEIEADVAALLAEIDRLKAALARLGSCEAFVMACGLGPDMRSREIVARIDYARAALQPPGESTIDQKGLVAPSGT